MIERYYRQFTPVCDGCGKRLCGQESRRDARRAVRAEGWEELDEEELLCRDCLFELKYGATDH